MARRFLGRLARELNRPAPRLADDALRVLMTHDWPGNVRELQNAIERAVVLSSSQIPSPRDFPAEIRGRGLWPAAADRDAPSRGETTGDTAPRRTAEGAWGHREARRA